MNWTGPHNAQKKYSLLSAGLCLLLIVLALSPLAGTIKKALSQDRIVAENIIYLDGVEADIRKNLLLLAEVNAFINVLKSSETGISFIVDLRIQVGLALDSLSKMTDKAFEATLFSLLATNALRWLLDIAELISPTLLVVALFFTALHYLLDAIAASAVDIKAQCRRLVEFSFMLFLSFHLLVPYSINATAFLDQLMYADFDATKNSNLANLHRAIVDEKTSHDLKERTKSDIKRFEDMSIKLPQKIDSMTSYYVDHFIYSIVRSIVIPLALFSLLLLLTRHLLLPTLFKPISINKPPTVITQPIDSGADKIPATRAAPKITLY